MTAVARIASNKRLKLTGHRALQISVLPFGRETKRFQLPGHQGRQLSREPLGRNAIYLLAAFFRVPRFLVVLAFDVFRPLGITSNSTRRKVSSSGSICPST
jgi:hypothetical protein